MERDLDPMKKTATTAGGERDPRLFVDSLEKGMRVLALFNYDTALTISDVAQRTGIGRSAAQRYVYTWFELNYIRKAASGKGYVLTPRVLNGAMQYLRSNSSLERAQPYLADANRQTLETVLWGELDDTEFVLLFRIPSQRSVSVNTPIGMRYPVHTSSSGLAILAFLPPETAADILDRAPLIARTPYTLTDRAVLDATLADIRETGYCITEQAYARGGISVSAPVFDAADRPIAAVNISTLLARHSRASVEAELVPVVVGTAQLISGVLGNTGRSMPGVEAG